MASLSKPASGTRRKGFTLIELLVALALMAVVIPVVVQALRVATLAGEVAQRKALAARIAERVLNNAIIMGQTQAATTGAENAGPYQFKWTLKDEPWSELGNVQQLSNPNSVISSVVNANLIHLFTVEVTYPAQGRNYSVRLSTLVNTSLQ